jgi:Rrf2 family protein
MPERFLLQILRSLVTNGLIKSIRGVDGGYVLAKTPKQISLLDVYESFDAPIVPSIPPLAGLSDFARKQLAQVMNRIAGSAQRELSQISLADLLQRHTSKLDS